VAVALGNEPANSVLTERTLVGELEQLGSESVVRNPLASPRNLERHECGCQIPVIAVKVSTLNKIITQAWPLVLDELEVVLPPETLDALAVQPCLNSKVDGIGQKRLVPRP
jgi:hypothetical protein